MTGNNDNGLAQNAYSKFIDRKRLYRLPGVFFILSGLVYLLWLTVNLNHDSLLLGTAFFLAQLYIYISFCLSIRNHWNAKYRATRPPCSRNLPVAVVVPTYNEPVGILKRTIKSILKIDYEGEMIVLLSNDSRDEGQKKRIESMMSELSDFWQSEGIAHSNGYRRDLHLLHTSPHDDAKAGNLNQAVAFFRKHYPHIDFMLTQDSDEEVSPEILTAIMGYFSKVNISYVQTIKRVKVSKNDPFGNSDVLWYARTAAAREFDNAMFACGSGVVWRISALESIGGFATWNLVEDLTTSYNLLSGKWEGRYHYEALSRGIAPEDLPNYLKQRGTWALDTLRIFFWDNPLFKKNLTWGQRLQFLELPAFYFNGFFLMLLLLITSASLFLGVWPTKATALQHALFLFPSFLAMEIYTLMLAGEIPLKRTRQLQIGMSPLFAFAAIKAFLYGPHKKPGYKVTLKKNSYGNYLALVFPQVLIILTLTLGILKSLIGTPLYSKFDWSIVFWSLYQTVFYFQIVRVSWWRWRPGITLSIPKLQSLFRAQTNVETSYSPDTLKESVNTFS